MSYSTAFAAELTNIALVMMEQGTSADEIKGLIDDAAEYIEEHNRELAAERVGGGE